MNEGARVLLDDAHDQALVRSVRPPGWKNPSPAGRYNLVVVGAGTAGLVTAAGAAGLGARVALVEKDLMGGDCLNVGCVPSKALIRASRAAADVRDAAELGIEGTADARVNFARVMERVRELRAQIAPNDGAARFQKLGVDVYLGKGAFVAPDAVEVAGERLSFSKAVIATGARATVPEIPGLADAGVLTNETVFTLRELPPRLAVIGAGPIGCELAQAFARLGARVTLVSNKPQVLPREDRDAAAVLQAALDRDGVETLLDARTSSVRGDGAAKVLSLEVRGEKREVTVDAILVGAGRSPNVEGLGLEKAGVSFDKTGVKVGDDLRTSNPRIFAAGDICSAFKFTHAADAMARIVIQNALFLGNAKASELTMPWCTYTDPEIAHVGLSEHEAREKGHETRTFVHHLDEVDRAVLDGETRGFAKLLLEKGSDRILGATLVSRHAGESISEVTLAIANGLGLRAIGKTIHPYPTQAEALKRVADAYNRTRLTPLVQKVLSKWLAWTR